MYVGREGCTTDRVHWPGERCTTDPVHWEGEMYYRPCSFGDVLLSELTGGVLLTLFIEREGCTTDRVHLGCITERVHWEVYY